MIKNILITGCSSGIGFETAKTLQNRGYKVIATVRKIDDATQLKKLGIDVVIMDVTDSNSIDKGLAETLTLTGGSLYALFNNAGFGIPGAVEDLNREALRVQFETNLLGPFELISKILPTMRQQGYGRIIQNSSILGRVVLPLRGAYNASKFAMEGLSDTLRLELTGTEIFVSLIEPGPIESNFRKNSYNAFLHYVATKESVFQKQYEQMKTRLTKDGKAVPFTLPASSVVSKVIHALECNSPKPRYYVTFPTYLFLFLNYILPTRILDKFLLKI